MKIETLSIDILENTVPLENRYSIIAYKNSGIYKDEFSLVYFVNIEKGMVTSISYNILKSLATKLPDKYDNNISTNDLLRAIAISQKPELAVELLK